MTEQVRWWASNIAVPVIVALCVGFGSSFFAAKLAIESLTGRVTALEDNVKRIEQVELVELKSTVKAAGLKERETSERLIRLESKIDLILSRQTQ